MLNKILRSAALTILLASGVALSAISVIGITPCHITNEEVKDIYNKLIAQTGQSQDALPLVIENNNIINAYNDGRGVHVFTGIINYVHNKDELALILAHEIAHGMLRHVYYPEFSQYALEISISEANADKLGAYYMMRAGYDLCKAREVWLRFVKEEGDYQGLNHPTYIYRYTQLNLNCDKL